MNDLLPTDEFLRLKKLWLIKRVAFRRERIRLEYAAFRELEGALSAWLRKLIKELITSGFSRALADVHSTYAATVPFLSQRGIRGYQKIIQHLMLEFLPTYPSLGGVLAILRWTGRESFDLGATTGIEELGFVRKAAESYIFELSNDEILDSLERRSSMASSYAASSTIRAMQSLIAQRVFMEGASVISTMEELMAAGVSPSQAYRVVQTEVQAGLGTARHEMFLRSGVQRKRWVTVGDNRVRPAHRENESQGWLFIGELFSSGSQHPGQGIDGINCRCVEEPDLSDTSILLVPWDGS